jgi:hypothetical protein
MKTDKNPIDLFAEFYPGLVEGLRMETTDPFGWSIRFSL